MYFILTQVLKIQFPFYQPKSSSVPTLEIKENQNFSNQELEYEKTKVFVVVSIQNGNFFSLGNLPGSCKYNLSFSCIGTNCQGLSVGKFIVGNKKLDYLVNNTTNVYDAEVLIGENIGIKVVGKLTDGQQSGIKLTCNGMPCEFIKYESEISRKQSALLCILCKGGNASSQVYYTLENPIEIELEAPGYNYKQNIILYNRTVITLELDSSLPYQVYAISISKDNPLVKQMNTEAKNTLNESNPVNSDFIMQNVFFYVLKDNKYYIIPSWYAGEIYDKYVWYVNTLDFSSEQTECGFFSVFMGITDKNINMYALFPGFVGAYKDLLAPSKWRIYYDNGEQVFPYYYSIDSDGYGYGSFPSENVIESKIKIFRYYCINIPDNRENKINIYGFDLIGHKRNTKNLYYNGLYFTPLNRYAQYYVTFVKDENSCTGSFYEFGTPERNPPLILPGNSWTSSLVFLQSSMIDKFYMEFEKNSILSLYMYLYVNGSTIYGSGCDAYSISIFPVEQFAQVRSLNQFKGIIGDGSGGPVLLPNGSFTTIYNFCKGHKEGEYTGKVKIIFEKGSFGIDSKGYAELEGYKEYTSVDKNYYGVILTNIKKNILDVYISARLYTPSSGNTHNPLSPIISKTGPKLNGYYGIFSVTFNEEYQKDSYPLSNFDTYNLDAWKNSNFPLKNSILISGGVGETNSKGYLNWLVITFNKIKTYEIK